MQTFCFHPTGDEGIRTLDPLLARQVLSQLSYTPKTSNVIYCLGIMIYVFSSSRKA